MLPQIGCALTFWALLRYTVLIFCCLPAYLTLALAMFLGDACCSMAGRQHGMKQPRKADGRSASAIAAAFLFALTLSLYPLIDRSPRRRSLSNTTREAPAAAATLQSWVPSSPHREYAELIDTVQHCRIGLR